MSFDSALRTFLLKADGQRALGIQQSEVERLVELHLRETHPDFAYNSFDEQEAYRLAARGEYVRTVTGLKRKPGQELVLLGGGFSLLSLGVGSAVEIDRPDVADKKRVLYDRLAPLRAIQVIGGNLEEIDLSEVAPLESTFVVAEGISYYLGVSTNERIFQYVANSGSTIVFDYFTPDVGPVSRYPDASRVFESLAGAKEDVLWTLDPERVEQMLSAHGLQLISHVSLGDIIRRYRESSSHNPWAYVAVAQSER